MKRRAPRRKAPASAPPAPTRLELASVHPVFAAHQRRFFDESLPPALSARAFTRFDAGTYSPEELRWGREAWQLRTLDEYRSYVGFTEFLENANALGLGFDVLSTAVRTVRDEARHVELCRRLVRALGGTDTIPGEPTWVTTDRSQPRLMQTLQMVIGTLCVGESLSVALLQATRRVASAPLARGVLTVLTQDEAVHSQVGWTLLPLLWPAASATQRRELEGELALVLDYAERAVFAGGGREAADGPRNPFGELFLSERRAVYAQALEQGVRRRFRDVGVRLPSSRPAR